MKINALKDECFDKHLGELTKLISVLNDGI